MKLNPPVHTDGLIELTKQLVDIASPSYHEQQLVNALEDLFGNVEHLQTTRVGDNLVVRTEHGHSQRLILAGHTDTVPASNNATAHERDGRIYGVGTTDMKSGLAVFIAAMLAHADAAIDLTLVLYAREEVRATDSGLGELLRARPDLLAGDLAILGEPTNANVEAGCQGTMRVEVNLGGQRAHTARPWMGDNAIHRLGPLLNHIAHWQPRKPVIHGCVFHESLQVVQVAGGAANNVVPDGASIVINHRFAPDRNTDDALGWLEEFLRPFLRESDTVELTDASNGALPATDHHWVQHIIAAHDLDVSAKLGWTDVAQFAEIGIPAINFGPGDPTVAHTQDEYVDQDRIVLSYKILDELIRSAS